MISYIEAVEEFSKNYIQRRPSLPDAGMLEEELYSMSGIDESDPHAFLAIPLDSPYLQYVGSACGLVGNRIFSNKSLVIFLQNRGVSEIIGIISEPAAEENYRHCAIGVNSLALPIAGKDGHIFESLAGKLKGSLRYERSSVPGWSIYESE